MINFDAKEVTRLIRAITGDSYTEPELRNFIHICKSMAEGYLRTRRYYHHLYFRITNEDQSDVEQLALDLIGPLFMCNPSVGFVQFQQYFQPHLDTIQESPEYGVVLLRRLVTSSINQELVNHFKQVDANGWKIYRNMKRAIRISDYFRSFEQFHQEYIYYCNGETPVNDPPAGLNPGLPKIPNDILEEWTFSIENNATDIPTLLEKLMVKVSQNTTYRRYISFQRIYRIVKIKLKPSFTELDPWSMDHDELSADFSENSYHFEKETILNRVTSYCKRKIKQTYLKSDKLSDHYAQYYSRILQEYFTDLIFSGSTDTLPQYMNHRKNGLNAGNNYEKHTHRLEYLIKLGKNELKEIFVEEGY